MHNIRYIAVLGAKYVETKKYWFNYGERYTPGSVNLHNRVTLKSALISGFDVANLFWRLFWHGLKGSAENVYSITI